MASSAPAQRRYVERKGPIEFIAIDDRNFGDGLSRGTVHTRQGTHVASIVQEGLMRSRTPLTV